MNYPRDTFFTESLSEQLDLENAAKIVSFVFDSWL